ncbi:MAG TPA: ribosomal L7Ae/L30e/S12e/Gadd45 family protein [Gemmatimonadales bacterium]|jgi:ribosomal protein L7Ae-like RNA K-turn-binding protein
MGAKRPSPPDALLGLIGLGLRGGMALPGVDTARSWLQSGECCLVVVASDATARAQEKVVRLAQGAGVPVITGPTADELGARLGRPPVMVVGVRDRALAKGMLAAVARQTE